MAISTAAERRRVQSLLSAAFDSPVEITGWERLAPWFVVRCTLAVGTSEIPRSVIVKSLRENPEGFRTDRDQVLAERAALEFLAELDVDLAPRLLASDTDAGLLVLEDLAPRTALYELLRDQAPGAEEGLMSFAGALGELAAVTVGRSDDYYTRRRLLGPVDPQVDRERFLSWGWAETRECVEAFGVQLPARAEAEMRSVFATLGDPGPFLAFSSGDAGANNYLVDGIDGRFIDFEFAGYRHALKDASCLYVPGSHWITVGDPVADGHEARYREALSEGIPQAADDELFGMGLSAACVASASIVRLHRLAKLDCREPGHDSRIQLVSTLEAAAVTATSHRSLPHLADWLREVAGMLRRRWPDADVDLTTYRPYTPDLRP